MTFSAASAVLFLLSVLVLPWPILSASSSSSSIESEACIKTADNKIVCGREKQACVTTPDGVLICGAEILKQPSVDIEMQSDAEEEEEEGSTGHSGYTRAQLGWSDWKHNMPYKQLGTSGLRVSALALGSWITFSFQFGEEKARELMVAAYDGGINFFDTAEAYADGDAETIMGNVIAWGVETKKWRRSDLVISTKVYWGKRDGGKIKSVNDVGLSRKHVLEGVTASLARLQLEYADIVFAHRYDRSTPVEETVRAFNHLIDTGKILYWGTSEWTTVEIERAWAVADRLGMVGPCAEQPSYSMLQRERMELEYMPLFTSSPRGLGTTIYSPLASGVLTGKYNNGIPESSRFTVKQYAYIKENYLKNGDAWEELIGKVEKIGSIAARLDSTPAQLALAWCLKNEHVSTVLLGASKLEQLQENFGALHVMTQLTPSVMAAIDAALDNAPLDMEKDFVAASMASNFPKN